MIRLICIAGAFVLLTGCGAPIPDGEIDTYCPECYRKIQNGEAFTPLERGLPDWETATAGAVR